MRTRHLLPVLSSCFVLLAAPGVMAAVECSGNLCGTPDQSGGGCGCGCGGSILVNFTDRGLSYQFADDFDGDGFEDEFDNCPFNANPSQLDADGDVVGDTCDLCPHLATSSQLDLDGDGIGNECDDDPDGDGVAAGDNCPLVPNAGQADADSDGMGNVCDADYQPDPGLDDDKDGVNNDIDSCPTIANPVDSLTLACATGKSTQPDRDCDGKGDACDEDMDGDGVPNYKDNCAAKANPKQIDVDKDGKGDNGDFQSGPESCDDQECYVVPGSTGCLSAEGGFQIGAFPMALSYTGTYKVGETATVVLLTNRRNASHQWTARFQDLPGDSGAVLANAQASAPGALPGGAQVAACVTTPNADGTCELNNIHFKVDKAGSYLVKITAELPQGDSLGAASSTAELMIKAEGEESGCAAIAAPSGIAALLLTLGGLLGRRRRRQ